MALKIEFDNSGGEIHIIIRDGCQVQLDPEDRRLSDLQRVCAQQPGLRRFLLLENINLTKEFRFDPETEFELFCPTCETRYVVTREMYNAAIEDFNQGYRRWGVPDKRNVPNLQLRDRLYSINSRKLS